MYVCLCRGVTEDDVRRAGYAGALSPDALISVLGLDDKTCCGRCVSRVDEIVALAGSVASHDGREPLHLVAPSV